MSTSPGKATQRRYRTYLVAYLVATLGSVWGLSLFYLFNYDFAVAWLGELGMTNPVVIVVLHSPAFATFGILLAYDGWRGVVNFLRTLIPSHREALWLPVLAAIMLAYVFAIRIGCELTGIPVPPNPMSAVEMLTGFLYLFYGEIGMVAMGIGWFGFFLPAMHRLTRSHLLSGLATGAGIAVYVAPGNLFSSFDLAIAWPLYATQLIILSIGMSYLLTRMRGNVLFFLIPFWVSASGSLWRMYYFTAYTQLIQLSLFAPLVVVLYLVLRREARGSLGLPHTFPEYLETFSTASESTSTLENTDAISPPILQENLATLGTKESS